MFSYTQFGATARSGEATQPSPNGYFQNFVYAQGQYLVNPRLQLTGTAFYETSRFNGLTMNPQATNLQSKGMSMHANYKVSEHFSVGAGVQISNGNSYLGNGLYQSPAFFPRAGRFNTMGGW
jgi:outer membrane protein assembly factor BamA